MKKRTMILLIIILILFIYLSIVISSLNTVISNNSLYYIENEDDIIHNVTIKILDKNNKTVHENNYTLFSNEHVQYQRVIQRKLPFYSPSINWSDGIYTFILSVDNILSDNITINIDQFMTICANLYRHDVPIEIQIATE
jgi:hypothetical protein